MSKMDAVKNYDYSGFGSNYAANFKASINGMTKMVSDLFSFGKGYILIGLLVLVGFIFGILMTLVSTYFVTLYTRRVAMIESGEKEDTRKESTNLI